MRPAVFMALLLLLLLPTAALAGGGGPIRLAQSFSKVNVGETMLYYQLMQHDVHPRSEGSTKVTLTSPDGQTVTVDGALDFMRSMNGVHVWTAPLNLDKPGNWRIKIEADHPFLNFPPLETTVEVVPVGSEAPGPGPVTPRGEGVDHSHSHSPSAAQTVSATAPQAPPAPAEVSQSASPLPYLVGGAVGAASAAALMYGALMVRQRPDQSRV